MSKDKKRECEPVGTDGPAIDPHPAGAISSSRDPEIKALLLDFATDGESEFAIPDPTVSIDPRPTGIVSPIRDAAAKALLQSDVKEDGDTAALKKPEIIDGKGLLSLKEGIRTYETASGDFIAASTDRGINYSKPVNQDRVGIHPKANLAVVADGIGGTDNGELAAQILTETFLKYPDSHPNEVINICKYIMKQGRDLYGNSGACFAAVKINENDAGNKSITISRVGDVKVLVFKKGHLAHESCDESWVQAMVEMGSINADEALYHTMRKVVLNKVSVSEKRRGGNALHDTVEAPYSIEVKNGDIILVMSDGISDNLTPDEIQGLIKGKSPEEIIEVLSDITDERMKNHKEITANTPDREKSGKFSDRYKSEPKPDNRGVAVIQIN